MSIIYCDKHDEHYDSDFEEDCPKCIEEEENTCEYCGGVDGEHEDISTDESDGEGHIMVGVGTQKCPALLEDEAERDL